MDILNKVITQENVRGIVKFVAGYSVSTLAGLMVKENLPSDLSPANRLVAGVGTFVLVSFVSDSATDALVAKLEGIINKLPSSVTQSKFAI